MPNLQEQFVVIKGLVKLVVWLSISTLVLAASTITFMLFYIASLKG